MKSLNRQHGFSLLDILVVMAVIAIVAAMAIPSTTSAMRGHRLSGDARSIANLVGMAKMRASARFTRARVRADLIAGTYQLDLWDKTNAVWALQDSVMQLSTGVTFGVGGITAAPLNTQAVLGQSPPCLTTLTAGPIANTACIVFNSRGVPVAGNAPVGDNAFYITDGIGVYGTTVTMTPLIRQWWSRANATDWIEK